MDELASRYQAVLAAIAQARGTSPRPVRLLAVSKTQPAAAVRALYGLGQRAFGENYAQEMAAKAQALVDLTELELVYIGRLQSNKIALLARWASAVQSLASERHARLLASAVASLGKSAYPVHILVNAGGEASKDGVGFAEALALAEVIGRELPQLALRGIMAIPPPLAPSPSQDSDAVVPPLYRELRRLADRIGLGELSLGMSADLAAAIAAGSDLVRIGTALFGARSR